MNLVSGRGQGYHIDGRPVRRDPNSQRPSSIEPELYNPLSPAKKRDQIALAGQQKHVLENFILKLKDQAITIKGLIAVEIFKGHPGSVAIPDIHAMSLETHSTTTAGPSDDVSETHCCSHVGGSSIISGNFAHGVVEDDPNC